MLSETGELSVRANSRTDGRTSQPDSATVFAAHLWSEVLAAKQPILLAGAAETDGSSWRREIAASLGTDGEGATAVLPLPPGTATSGCWSLPGTPRPRTCRASRCRALTDFAQQAGLALLAGRAQRDRALVALLDDRDRIARDMHDHVIQRLFATGLSLQSAARLATHPLVQPRIEEAVDDLDAAIKEIRHAIYQLHRPVRPDETSERLTTLAASFTEALGFRADLQTDGSLDRLGSMLASDLLAVVREGLANVAKHAGATQVRVTVGVDEQSVCVEVADDGSGVDPASARGGLVNLSERAAARHGTFEILPEAPHGTLLRWRVPR